MALTALCTASCSWESTGESCLSPRVRSPSIQLSETAIK